MDQGETHLTPNPRVAHFSVVMINIITKINLWKKQFILASVAKGESVMARKLATKQSEKEVSWSHFMHTGNAERGNRQSPQTASPTGDLVFKYMSQWETFLI